MESNIAIGLDKYTQAIELRCWVCSQKDERDGKSGFQVPCWEDIDVWILQDPHGAGGRDQFAMQVLFRSHKGQQRMRVPTWFIFVEEDLPMLCPTSHILAKALAEGVVASHSCPTKAGPFFFRTKSSREAVKVECKREWMHRPGDTSACKRL